MTTDHDLLTNLDALLRESVVPAGVVGRICIGLRKRGEPTRWLRVRFEERVNVEHWAFLPAHDAAIGFDMSRGNVVTTGNAQLISFFVNRYLRTQGLVDVRCRAQATKAGSHRNGNKRRRRRTANRTASRR